MCTFPLIDIDLRMLLIVPVILLVSNLWKILQPYPWQTPQTKWFYLFLGGAMAQIVCTCQHLKLSAH